jgi:hypothetical protein
MTAALVATLIWMGETPLRPSEGLAALYANLDDRIHRPSCGKEFVEKPVRLLLADWLDAAPASPRNEPKAEPQMAERKFSLWCEPANPTKQGGWACSLWVAAIEKKHGGLLTWFLTPERRYLRNRVRCNEDND